MRLDRTDGLERLGTALDLYASWDESKDETWAQFLERHEDYRDLLEQVADGYRDSAITMSPDSSSSSPSTDSGSTMVGRQLGDFRIVQEIGRGGMGVVYEAEQLSLNRRVALKVLAGDQVVDPVWIARFKREAATIAKLNHGSIISVLAVGSEGGLHYFAMELIHGAALNKVFETVQSRELASLTGSSIELAVRHAAVDDKARQGDSESSDGSHAWQRGYIETLVELIAQVAEALQHTHDSGVIHRDVKPGNILVRLDGRAVLTDFGLAREESLPSMTHTGQFAGTPYYVSPEQALARLKHLDHRTDVYSLGATLYELVTLKRPFDGGSTHEILQRIISGDPVDPQKINRHLPADLAAVILKAMEKTPAHRYQSAAEMAADLRAFLNYRPVRARRPQMLQRVGRWVRRGPMRAALVAVIAVAVPLVTGLTGYTLAKQTAIKAGEGALLSNELDGLFVQAHIALESYKYEEALQLFDEVLKLQPDNVEAIAGIATTLTMKASRTGSDKVALLEETLAVIDAHPELLQHSVALGQLKADSLKRLGRIDEAKTLASGLGPLRTPFDFYNASRQTLLYGRSGSRRHSVTRALDLALVAVMSSEQSRPLYHFNVATTARYAKDTETLKWISHAMLHLWPDAPVARYLIGVTSADQNPTASIRIFEQLIKEIEDGDTEYAWMHRYLKFHLGFAKEQNSHLRLAKEQSKELKEAISLYRQALPHMPNGTDCRFFLARALATIGKAAEAQEELREGIKQHPKEQRFYVLLSHLIAEGGDLQAGLAMCETGLAQIPGELHLLVLKGMTLGRLQRYEESGEVLQQVLKIAPDNAFALHNSATLLAKQGKFEQARDLYVRTAEIQPRTGFPWYSAGLCDLRLKETDRAARCFRKALQLQPDHQPSHDKLVEILQQQGRDEEVEAELTRFRNAPKSVDSGMVVPIKK